MFIDWSFLLIFTEPWFWQGIIINTLFSIASIPFTNKIVQKVFRNRKRNRIKNALNEIKVYCLQQIIKDKHINRDNFENQLYIIANRYELDIKDIYNDKNIFDKTLIHSILEVNIIDGTTKEKIANQIRKNEIFIEPERNNSLDDTAIFSADKENINDNNNFEDISLNKNEKKNILKYTAIITGIFFVFLLIYTFLCQVLIKAYGNNSVIFINTIIIIISIIPILVNGIIHLKSFNEQNKIYFCFLLLISVLNIINFICMIGILLK